MGSFEPILYIELISFIIHGGSFMTMEGVTVVLYPFEPVPGFFAVFLFFYMSTYLITGNKRKMSGCKVHPSLGKVHQTDGFETKGNLKYSTSFELSRDRQEMI